MIPDYDSESNAVPGWTPGDLRALYWRSRRRLVISLGGGALSAIAAIGLGVGAPDRVPLWVVAVLAVVGAVISQAAMWHAATCRAVSRLRFELPTRPLTRKDGLR